MTSGLTVRAIAVFAASFAFSTAVAAADPQKDNKPRRLESVTWNSVDHKLVWVISTGEKTSENKYKPLNSETYEISMDAATMSFHGESRRFSDDEAASVHALMDLISKYAVESTVWWDDGQGIKLDKNGKPEPVQQQPVPKTIPKSEKNVTLIRYEK